MSVTLEILVKDNAVTKYTHKGKTYIEGRVGSEYKLKITNNSFSRILVIPSVDGLSIVDGQTASDKSKGYVLSAYQQIIVPGWLKNDKEAAKFEFSSSSNSYTDKSGKGTTNCGVIGLMVFDEKVKAYNLRGSVYPLPYNGLPWANDISYTTCSASNVSNPRRISASSYSLGGATAMGMSSATLSSKSADEKVGTGWGANTSFATTNVEFERQEKPSEIVSMFYDTRRNLEKLGIKFTPEVVDPNPFPEYQSGYCQPPR